MSDNFICNRCDHEVTADSDFCPNCGNLFVEVIMCSTGDNHPAEGCCVICGSPYCKNHGKLYQYSFMCDEHSGLECFQGMARVFGSSDFLEVNFYNDCLSKAGLHPFIYERKTSPISLGGVDYSLFRASGEFDGHIINELKLMVPFPEVLEAQKTITDVDRTD